jgi:alkane 1-monooxygenase
VIFLPLFFAWLFIPLIEMLIKPDPDNMSITEEELAKKNKGYDVLLYLVVVIQYFALYEFLHSMKHDTLAWYETTGRIFVMGLLCGVFGINVGHELGHRVNKMEQVLAKALLLTSLYMHFFTEHNKGHHKRVATPEDPSSARLGEPVYTFYFRTIFYSYISAWHIANDEIRKRGRAVFHYRMKFSNFLSFSLPLLD